jgi:hypothetical protein
MVISLTTPLLKFLLDMILPMRFNSLSSAGSGSSERSSLLSAQLKFLVRNIRSSIIKAESIDLQSVLKRTVILVRSPRTVVY